MPPSPAPASSVVDAAAVGEKERERERARFGLDPGEPAADPASFLPWVATGSAKASIDASEHPFPTNPNTLRLVASGKADGIRNPGYWGINARPGSNFTVSFYAKSAGVHTVTAKLIAPGSSNASVAPIASAAVRLTGGSAWTKYSTTLLLSPSARAVTEAAFELTAGSTGIIWLDSISLIPGDAVAGLFRKDIYDKACSSPTKSDLSF